MSPGARAAVDRGAPVLVDRVKLRDGRTAVRVRLPGEVLLPAVGKRASAFMDTPGRQASRRREVGLWAAGSALALGVLGVVGWLVWTAVAALVGLVAAHGWEVGAAVALLVLAAAGGGTCVVTVTVQHSRH